MRTRRRRLSRRTPQMREFRSRGHPKIASRFIYRRGCASTPSHGLWFHRESCSEGHILDSSRTACTPNIPFCWEPEESPRADLALVKSCTTSRQSSPARRAPFFLRDAPRFGHFPAAFEEARRPTNDLPARRGPNRVRSLRARVWPLAGVASQTREVLGSWLESDASI